MPICTSCKGFFQYKTICHRCEQKMVKKESLPKQVNLIDAKRILKEATYNKIIQEVYVFGDKIIDIIEAGKREMLY